MTRILSPEEFVELAKSRKLHYRTTFAGLPISIENRKGSRRYWTDPETGEEGSTLMEHPYGYIRGRKGADGDEVDVFLGPDENSNHVFIVNQRAGADLRRFDEHKVMLGFRTLDEARAAYLKHYNARGPQLLGSIREWTMERFKRWLDGGDLDEPVQKGELPLNLFKGGPYIGPRGGKWADAAHTIPWSDEHDAKPQKIPLSVHPKIAPRGDEHVYVADVGDGHVRVSPYEDAKYGPTMPRESVKHFVNDLAGKVDLPKSGNAAIDSVIDGKATLLGKGDDGIAFKVGDQVVKVSTTVPFQPMNPGHRSPEQAADMLRAQVETGNKLADEGIPALRSTFVKHGDKGFQIKPHVDIPEKWTRAQLDTIQDAVHEMHAKGYAMNDDIQAGLVDGKIVFYDTGKVAEAKGSGIYSETSEDLNRLRRLYEGSGEKFVNKKDPESKQTWDRVMGKDGMLDRMKSGANADFVRHWLDKASNKRVEEANATLTGKALKTAIMIIEEETEWAREDINMKVDSFAKKAGVPLNLFKGGPYIGPRGGKWADAAHTIPWTEKQPATPQLGLDFAPPVHDSAHLSDEERDLKIAEIVHVHDTRERELVEGEFGRERSRPIPGSGVLSVCSRCGKEHEVHATVRLTNGKHTIMGTGCAKKQSPEMASRIGTLERAAKALGKASHELTAARKKVVEVSAKNEAAKKVVEGLELPDVHELSIDDPEADAFARKMLEDGRRRVFKMGDAEQVLWVSESTNPSTPYGRDYLHQQLTSTWREKRLKEHGYDRGAERDLKTEIENMEKRVRKLSAQREAAVQKSQVGGTMDLFKGGPYLGPKGGLYADPEHKVAWSEKTHGKVQPHHCPRCKGVAHVVSRQPSLIGGAEHVTSAPCNTCNAKGKHSFNHEKAKEHGIPTPPEHAPKAPEPQLSLHHQKKEQLSLFSMVGIPLDLFKGLGEGVARGGKYIRRVPYTDAHGKRKYRYYYSETASARDVTEGEEVRLGKRVVKVEKVEKDGTITLRVDGRAQKVSPNQWHSMMARAYGPRFHGWAKKRAEQAINAVLRHVPREALVDLKGSTDEERLAELRVRVPEVYAKLQKSFKQAGVDPFRAKQILARSLERRRWEPEARAAVLGSILQKHVKATSFDQIVRAAENLAGGFGLVKAEHASSALALRAPGGDEERFPAELEATAKAAEKELAKLSALLAKARHGDRTAMAEVLAHGVGADATHHLAMLLQAFPGLRDNTAEKARTTLAEVPSVAPRKAPKQVGSDTVLYVAGEGGQPQALRARYRLIEASEVRASHDPLHAFKKREDYPEGVQERAYHRDQSEQAKVIRNAQRLKPAFLINTNPDAVNGPPMITQDGVALGGNSRTMSMQVAYAEHPDKAAEMKSYMREHAHEFGLTGDDVDAMEAPILVREVTPEGKDKHSKEEMRLLVRQMNESFTQGMDPRAMQVAMGRKLDDAALKSLGDNMQPDETLGEFLSTSRSEHFTNALHRTGIIDDRSANQYMHHGRLNEDGKTLVARILMGRLVGDADLLSNTQKSTVDAIAQSAIPIMQAKSYGDKYDVRNDLAVAISARNHLQTLADKGTIKAMTPDITDAQLRRTMSHFESLFSDDRHPVASNPMAQKILEVLIRRPGTRQMSDTFKRFLDRASKYPENQTGFFGDTGPSPMSMMERALASSIEDEEAEKAARAAEKEARENLKNAKVKDDESKAKDDQGGLFGKGVRFGLPKHLYNFDGS